jgi:agmatine deiminase
MPAEWGPHQACLITWPAAEDLWGSWMDGAKAEYAAVARAVAAFEPVVMVCDTGSSREVRNFCGDGVEPLEIPIDDSWIRDNGPIFLTGPRATLALVDFGFNGWGERYTPYDRDTKVPEAVATHMGVKRYVAPFVLEGGAFLVDGEGTLITTEQCLLHPNRNPNMTRAQIEDGLRAYLGVESIVWLPRGMAKTSTDGHIDGVAQYVSPGVVALLVPDDPSDPNNETSAGNLAALAEARDSQGRSFEVLPLGQASYPPPAGDEHAMAYLNSYLANGAVIAPLAGIPDADDKALARLAEIFPDREVVGVSARILSYGGGGPHCITQQIPVPAREIG